MKNCTFLIILSLSVTGISLGQSQSNNFFFVKAGFGNYYAPKLERLQEIIYENNPSKGEILQSFPINNYFQIDWINITTESFNIGFFYGYASTGGRIDYSDYSGRLTNDIIVSKNQLGIRYEEIHYLTEKFNFVSAFELSTVFSSLLFNDFLRIDNQTMLQSHKFRATSIGMEINVAVEYRYKILILRPYVGGQASIFGQYRDKKDKEVKLFTEDGTKHGPEWLGFKLGIASGIAF